MLQVLQPTEKQAPAEATGGVWHLITCEYPPQTGGVADHTYFVAKGLAERGDQVHVWCPSNSAPAPENPGVQVHALFGKFSPLALRAVGKELDRFPQPRRMLLQWVPHGFGYKSMNLPFCLWLWHRAAHRGDQIDLMVHELFLPFARGKWRQNVAAVIHRMMLSVVLRSVQRVWVSTPSWSKLLPRFDKAPRTYGWLPVVSNVPVIADPAASRAIHNQYAAQKLLIGHFGTFGESIADRLRRVIPPILDHAGNAAVLLFGTGSKEFCDALVRQHAELKGRVHAAGRLNARDLSLHLSACDLLIQPYPDGVTTRRGTIMASLSHGRPAVTTTGILSEPFWESSGAVALVPADDTEAFVALSARLLENPSMRESLGAAGQDYYQRKFAIEHVVDRLRARLDDGGACPSGAGLHPDAEQHSLEGN